MESEVDIKKKFDRLVAKTLASPLPKLKYRGPIKKSRLTVSSLKVPASNSADLSSSPSTSKPTTLNGTFLKRSSSIEAVASNSTDLSSKKLSSVSQDVQAGGTHQILKLPSSETLKRRSFSVESVTPALISAGPPKTSMLMPHHVKKQVNHHLSELTALGKSLERRPSAAGTPIIISGKNLDSATDDEPSGEVDSNRTLRNKNKLPSGSARINHKQLQQDLTSSPDHADDTIEQSSRDVDALEVASNGRDPPRVTSSADGDSKRSKQAPSDDHDEMVDGEEEDDLPCSGHVSQPCDEDDEDEISSVIDEEEEFFMHKPRPDRNDSNTTRDRKLNIDALWSRVILKTTPEEENQFFGSKEQNRFLHRNLQNGKYFFKVYFSKIKHVNDGQQKLIPDDIDIEVFQDGGETGRVAKKRGVKRKSISQAVIEDAAQRSNKKTRSKSQQGKGNKLDSNDKTSNKKGRRLKSETPLTEGQPLKADKRKRGRPPKAKVVKTTSDRNVGRSRSYTKKVPDDKSLTARSSTRLSSTSKKSSTKTSAILPHHTDGDVAKQVVEEEKEEDIVFFDVGDDKVQKALKPNSRKVTVKRSKANSTSVTNSKGVLKGKGDQVNKMKQGGSKKKVTKMTSQGRKQQMKTTWTISDGNASKNVASKMMPLSHLTRTLSVTSSGTETDLPSVDEDADDPFVASSMTGDVGFNIRPLFGSFRNRSHCGSIWKSIVDET